MVDPLKTKENIPIWLYSDLFSATAWSLLAIYTFSRFMPAFLFWTFDSFWTPLLFVMEATWIGLAGWCYRQHTITFDKFDRGELDV